MQKKIKKSLAAILSLLMIMTVIPFAPVAVATDGADPITEKDCTEHADTDGNEFCDVCGELINAKVITADSDGMVYVDGEALEITGYYNNDLILPAGNYKLTGDVTSAYYINANEGEVTLDLNGYVWDMKDCYLLLSNQFSLYDTSDAGTGKLTSSWIETVYIGKTDTQCGTFNLYSGTVENTSTLTDSYIISASYGDANLYGGKIKGNAYAFFNYMFSDLTINLDGTVIENGEGYAQIKTDLMDGDTPKTVIDVTDYTGESFTVDAEIDEEGKIKIFEGIKSAQEAENYQINFLTKYGEVYCEKIEYDEATGEKYIYVLKNAFTQQPSDKNNYTVEFNNPDASFQWYEVNENEIGKYTTEEGDHFLPYDFKKGDILKVTTASEIEYAVIEAGSYYLRLDKENKSATVRIDEDETIEIFTRFVDPENDVELIFSVIKEISLEGETGKTLQTPKYEKSYWCKATVGTKVYPSDIAFICYTHDYDENGKCYYCKMQAAAKVTDKDGNKLSDSPYETFAEAVTAASASEGSTLTLLDDVTLTKEQNIRSGKFTLDLNGKNLINENGRVLYIYKEADLTIKDSGETGTLESMNDGSSVIWNYGTLTVESGIIKGAGGIDNKGTLTFKDGTVEVVTYSAISNTGTAYVYDGVLKNAKSFALGNYGTLYVYDGEIDGIINDCDAYISGGEIDCDNYAALNLLGGKLEVTGGSFTGTDLSSGYYSGTPYGEWTVYFGEDATLTLKGGEFPNGFAVANTTANTSLAEGYAFYDKDGNKITVADDAKIIDGYVQVKERFVASVTDKDGNELSDSPYKTFAEAVTAASASEGSEGSTITLLDDVNLTSMLEIASGKFILDLNGKTIINPDGIEIGSAAELTIVDSASGGKISGDMFGILNDGSLTVNGGVIKASCAVYNYGTVTVDGGNIQGYITNNGALIVNDGILTRIKNPNTSYTATVEINGGTFTDFNTIENNDGDITVKGGIYPNGFSVTNDGNLEYTANSILAEDYYYKDADGKLIDVADDAKIINGYVKVSKGADLSEAVITLDQTQFTYSGTEHKPTVIVTVGGKTLTEGKDYTLTFANNVNAGIATVTVRGISQAAGGIAGGGEDIGNSSNSGDITESIYTGKIIKNFTIKPATVDIIWEGDEFYYTGNPHKVTAKYVDVNGDENPAAITQNKTNTEIGKYIATAIVEDANYTANSATANHTYEIKWYDGAPDATVSGTKGENGWYTSEVTVTAPEGYAISTLADGIYGSEVTFGNEEKAVYYLKQAETGYIAKIELGKFAVDLNDPEAEIVIGEYKWNTNATAISFGLFFKETKAFSISASDSESGIAKAEYFVATEKITDFGNIEWIEYTGAVSISPNSKNIIYAKVTDISGRYIIVNSDGIVLYTDSTLDTSFKDEVVYVLTKNASQSFNLNLNGNTVAYIKIGETVLGTEDYEVLGNMIIVSSDVLENLAAGNYPITVGVNPLGEAYVDGDAPAEVIIPLTVKKADVTIEISDFGKVYDGKPVTADYKISKSSDSSPAVSNIDYNETVEFKVKDADDSTYTAEAPVNAGEYTVRITVAETDKINSAEATADFIIEKREVTATATAPDKVYDGTVNLDFSKVVITFDGIVDGDDVSYEIMGGAYVSANVAEKVRVAVSYDVSGMDVSNYEFGSGAAIPEAKYYSVMTFASIVAKDISDGFIILGEPLTYNGTEQTQTVEKVLPTGTAPEATFTVSGNKATNVGVYLLTVTGTGNYTGEAKITFEIAVDMNGVDFDRLHPLNVKASDKEKIEYIYNQLDNASRDYADAEKCNEWDSNKSYCVELLKIIESVADKLEGFKNKLAVYDIDTVTSDDADDLDSFYNDEVAKVYNDYFDNLTEEQTKELDNILLSISALQKRISDVAKEITRITNAVNSYDEATVKSSDKADLEQLVADIKALTDATNITEAERAKLEALDEKVDALIKKIDETQSEIDRINGAVANYNEETVKSSDSEDLAQLKEDIQSLIDSDNTTENEKTALEGMIKDIEGLEDKITETEEKLEEIKGIENNFNPENVSSDDKAAIEDKIAEIEAVNPDNLTDEQKAEYDEIKAGFEALLEEIAAAEKAVEDIGIELEMFDEKRVTKFWEDDIEALKTKIDELLADENMGEAEKAKLNEYKAQCDKLIEIINTPVKYFSFRFFYLIWDFLVWAFNGILWIFSKFFA